MADEEVAVSEGTAGSGVEEAAAGSGSTGDDGGAVAAGGVDKPFSFGWFDGTKSELDFKDPSKVARELGKINEAFRHGSMRHEELQAERRKIGERQKAMEDAIKRAQAAEERSNTAYGMYKPWDDLMTSRPDLRREVEAVLDKHRGNGGGRQSIADLKEALMNEPEFREQREGYEEWKKDRQARERERTAAEAARALKAEIGDYDDEAVTAFINALESVPKKDGERKLREIIHYALVGMTRAGVLEQRKAGMPKRPSVPSTPGKSTTGPELSELPEDEQEKEIIRRLKEIPESEE